MKAVWLLGAALLGACTEKTELIPDSGPACVPPGNFIHLGGAGDVFCAAALGARFSRYALCGCSSLILSHGLFTDSIDSGRPEPSRRREGGVGTNGGFQVAGPLGIGGALDAAGPAGIVVAQGSVDGELRSGGNLSAGVLSVTMGDAFVTGDVTGEIEVGGVLHVQPPSMIGTQVRAMRVIREPVPITPACDCGADQPDLSAAITARSTDNNNGQLGFSPTLLGNVNAPTTLHWPCGEYFVPGIHGAVGADLEWKIHGRVGIFVEGDVDLGGSLNVLLDRDAELDLVIGGDLIAGGGMVGAPLSAAKTRIWVGSTSVSFPNRTTLAGLLYAPAAVLSVGTDFSATGALLVQSVAAEGDLHLHFDRALLEAATSCGPNGAGR